MSKVVQNGVQRVYADDRFKLTPPYHGELDTIWYIVDEQTEDKYSLSLGSPCQDHQGSMWVVEEIAVSSNRITIRQGGTDNTRVVNPATFLKDYQQ